MEPYTDILRVLVATPTFAYASYLDTQERRVPHRTWIPLAVVALVAFGLDLVLRAAPTRELLTFAAFSFALGALFGYGFYYLGTFGGADRYALVVLAVAFPVYPVLPTPVSDLPLVVPEAPIFFLSVLGNTVIVGLAYPLKLLAENLSARNTRNPGLAFLAKRVEIEDLHREFGRVIGDEDEASIRRSGVFSDGGVSDIDFVRDYVEWRGVDSLAEVRDEELCLEGFVDETPWESDEVDEDEEALRELVSCDAVWISPGIPFVVPIFVGLLVALTYGDVLFALTRVAFGL